MTAAPLLSILLAACDRPAGPETVADPAPAVAPADRPNVLLVTIDTTRADHIGAYGYEAASTPTLDGLADVGMLFDRAYSPVPLTIPSHSTLMTGLDVYRHGVRNNGDGVLGEQFDTLAELFKQAGYATAASVGAFVTARDWGFGQGFDAYFDQMPEEEPGPGGHNQWAVERPAESVVDDALGWLQHREEGTPWFLWVHVYDPHHPVSVDASWLERFENPYDAEIAYTDAQLGRLIEDLDLDDTVVAVMADHGEGHGGHAEILHGLFLYNGTQRVPMILAGPGVEVGVETDPVGIVDMAPTLLDLAGLPVPDGLDGKIQPGNPHPLYLESYQLTERFGYAPHVALVDGDRKLIELPRPELYDQKADVREQHDLSLSEPETVARMQALLSALEVPSPTATQSEIDAEAIAQLQALGYVSGGIAHIEEGELPDPKDKVKMVRLLQQAERHRHEGDHRALETKLREAIALDPLVPEPYLKLSRSLSMQGRHDDAKALMLSGVAHRPEDPRLLLAAAITFGSAGEPETALDLIRRCRAIDPSRSHYVEVEIGALFSMGRNDEGTALAKSWLAEHADAYGVAAAIGTFYGQQGDLKTASPYLVTAAEAPSPRRDVFYMLGKIAAMHGDDATASAMLAQEVTHHPGHLEARVLLSRSLGALGRYEEQLEHVEFLLKVQPKMPDFWHGKSVTLLNLGDAEGALAAAEHGLTLSEGNPDLMLMKANALAKLGRRDEGQALFQEAQQRRAKLQAEQAAAGQETPPAP